MYMGGPSARPMSMVRRGKFTPGALNATQLMAWWDFSDTATLTKDGGNVLSAVADKSGNSRTLTSAGSPVWGATAFNSTLAGLTFDGVDDVLSRAESFLFASATGFTALLSMTSASPGTSRTVFGEASTSSATPSFGWMATNSTTASTACTSYTNDAATAVLSQTASGLTSFTSTPTVNGRLDTLTGVSGRKNGASLGSAAYTRSATTLTTFSLGAKVSTTTTRFMPMVLRQFVVFAGINASLRDMVEGFLAWDCGATLAAGHPYEFGPP